MSELARRDAPATDLIAIASQTRQIKELGSTLIASGLLPDAIKSPEAAMLIMLKGQEIGMSAIYALSHIAIIKGKPAMSAEAMQALVQKAGHVVRIVESTAERCVVEGVRRNDPDHPTRIEWTMEDAKRAGLAGGQGPWKTYPRAMLRSRAISELCRATFADVLSGVSYVPEELGAAVNEDGEIVAEALRPPQEDAGPSEPIEEAEVLEDEEEHDRILASILDVHGRIPEDVRPDGDSVMEVARTDVRKARKTLKRLNQILEGAEGEVAAREEVVS